MAVEEDLLVEEIEAEQEDQEAWVPVYKIISYPADYTLQGLYDKNNRGELIIPEFQRGSVWSHKQSSKLIDSFLRGLPVPAISLYKEPSEKHLVVDGQQRLRTICGYFDSRLPDGKKFFLKDVSPQWEGKYYNDLEESERIWLRDSVLRAVIVEQLDPKDDSSVYHIFERLNSGGTILTPQEVRNSSYHGPFNDLIKGLNNDPTWREIFGSSDPDRRTRDVELIVRFLALLNDGDSYIKPMKEFLNRFMSHNQQEKSSEPYESVFTSTVKRITDNLGRKPFHIRRGINAPVFDSVMVAFAHSQSVPDDISDRFSQLLENASYQEDTSSATTDVDTVKRRIKTAREILYR